MYDGKACQRCAGPLALQGKSKAQAVKDGTIVRSDWHELADCIRHLAAMVG